MLTLRPQPVVTESETDAGLRALVSDGVCSQAMGAFTGGAFLIAFALELGASNLVVGLIAAAQPLAQILQIPAIFLVEKLRTRKLLVVSSAAASRLLWPVVALIPWVVRPDLQAAVLLLCLFVHFGLGAIAGCAFNSWMRDFVPEAIRGDYFGKRLAVATIAGAALTIPAAAALDYAGGRVTDPSVAYSVLFLVGAAAGIAGCLFLARIPEAEMSPGGPLRLADTLLEPLADANFRNLLYFLGSWNFAINLAAPFFTVYMLQRIGLSMAAVLALSVASQVVNAGFFRVWGRLADRYSNKTVLGVAGWLFVISIAIWPFTTLPERYVLTVPLLLAIHFLAGISTAGVNLCSSTIALELAPKGKATAFLATSSLTNGIAATIAPIVAGLGVDRIGRERVVLEIRSITGDGDPRFVLGALDLQGLDFLFVAAFVLGLYALHRLLAVREEGEVDEDIVVMELYGEVRKAVRHVSNVAGLRRLTYFPFGILRSETHRH